MPGMIDSRVPVRPEIITNLIDSILNAMPQIVEAGFKLLVSLVKNLPKVIVTIAQANVKIINSIINAILKSVPKMVTTGFNLLVSIIKNLPKVITLAVKGIGEVLTGIRDAITSFSLVDAGENLIKGVWQGISNVKQWLLDQIQAIFGSAVSLVKKVLGIHSPSTVFAEIGEYCVKGFEKGIEPLADGTLISGAFDNIKNKLGSAYSELELSPVIGSRNVSVYEGQNRTDELLNELLSYFKDDMKDDLTSAMANGVKFDWNNRNLGRMVKTYA